MEAQEDALRARLAAASVDVPDIHPNISEIYRRKVERLTHSLSQPEECQEAADALRALIERIDLTPGAKRGEVNAMLYGEFGRILEWIEQRRVAENAQSPGALASGLCGMSVSVVAGARNHLNLHFPAYAPFDDNRLKIISEYLEFFNVAPCLYQTAA
ncbi:hypothetical protein [Sphingobium sp. Ant17]|uniref:hypothetical protein n=1 Tax=Sphingobium sp. Ant17 TaxID=1461752 RepID=UPI001F368429|nr:hypothetical protein [Sphingobium sp. Ant17]